MLGKLSLLFPDEKFDEACKSIFKFVNSRLDEPFLYLKNKDKRPFHEKECLAFMRELAKVWTIEV
jgi:hypothetical protein